MDIPELHRSTPLACWNEIGVDDSLARNRSDLFDMLKRTSSEVLEELRSNPKSLRLVSEAEPTMIAETGQSLRGHRVAGWKKYYVPTSACFNNNDVQSTTTPEATVTKATHAIPRKRLRDDDHFKMQHSSDVAHVVLAKSELQLDNQEEQDRSNNSMTDIQCAPIAGSSDDTQLPESAMRWLAASIARAIRMAEIRCLLSNTNAATSSSPSGVLGPPHQPRREDASGGTDEPPQNRRETTIVAEGRGVRAPRRDAVANFLQIPCCSSISNGTKLALPKEQVGYPSSGGHHKRGTSLFCRVAMQHRLPFVAECTKKDFMTVANQSGNDTISRPLVQKGGDSPSSDSANDATVVVIVSQDVLV